MRIVCVSLVVSASVACTGVPSAGMWWAEDALSLPAHYARSLGGPLTAAEARTIKEVSRAQLERAFAGLRISFTDRQDAVWRVEVVRELPGAGEAFTWGLRGWARVGFVHLASNAIQHAPPGAQRPAIVRGIGTGIGRAAAHELAHLIGAGGHNATDADSYEYIHADRPSQYYGELHWTTAGPLLQRRLRPR
jgi:hypothetical protein